MLAHQISISDRGWRRIFVVLAVSLAVAVALWVALASVVWWSAETASSSVEVFIPTLLYPDAG